MLNMRHGIQIFKTIYFYKYAEKNENTSPRTRFFLQQLSNNSMHARKIQYVHPKRANFCKQKTAAQAQQSNGPEKAWAPYV